MRSSRLKRMLDVAGSAALLAVFALPMTLVALAIMLRMGRPVLFTQIRPGLHGELFRLYKFRTMLDARNADGELLPDEERLTGLGQFLRSTSLDELPALFNVIKGDMSLVGPRPLLPEYLERYTPQQARRHDVRPGITGLAQVGGRNALSWEAKFELDVRYVDTWSLWLDLRILTRTIAKVLLREGIAQPGRVTADEFLGSSADTEGQGPATLAG
ncbi:MAG TPA: sugar transferase [Egibacteraceae bacterium]|nr:sugar transferase [Egibacteraceae bacterium]